MADPKRKRYLKDVEQNADGSLSYTGDVYRINGDEAGPRSVVMRSTALAAITAVVIILSGCIDAAGANNAFYVIIPFIGEVSSAFAICWSLAKLIGEKNRFRAFILDPIRTRIPGACKMLAAFALLGATFSILYMIRNGIGGELIKSIAYPALKVLTAILAISLDKYFARIEWVKCK